MKRFRISIMFMALVIILLGDVTTASAVMASASQKEIIALEDGCYIETEVCDVVPEVSLLATEKTLTKTKTMYYKNQSGTVLWSLSITATFTYDGKSAKCIRCSHDTSVLEKGWSIKSCSSSKSGNSATVRCVAAHVVNSSTKDFSTSITIQCSKDGKVS